MAATPLNNDVLGEILAHLTAKAVIRLKSVSKQWNYVISTATFSRLHMLRHPNPYSTFFLRTSFLLRPLPPQFHYFNPTTNKFIPFHSKFAAHAQIRQSCNGLLLLEHKDYYVYNPCTAQSRNLHLKHERILGLHLSFDPSESLFYKVICLRLVTSPTTDGFDHLAIEAYDSETHTWNKGKKVYLNNIPSSLLEGGILWKNCIYSVKPADYSHNRRLWCFDIEKGGVSCAASSENVIVKENVSVKLHEAGGLTMFSVVESASGGGDRGHCVAVNKAMNYRVVCEIKGLDCHDSLRYMFKKLDGHGKDYLRYRDRHGSSKYYDESRSRACTKFCFLGNMRIERNLTKKKKKRKERNEEEEEEEYFVFHFPDQIMCCRNEPWMYSLRFDEVVNSKGEECYRDGPFVYAYRDSYHFVESLAPV